MANQEYPKWLYHATEGSRLLASAAEEKELVQELGPGWEIHPDKARAEHIKKVNELRAKSDDDKKKLDEKNEQDKAKVEADKAKVEADLAKQLAAQNPSAKKAAADKAAVDAKAASDAKATADKKAADDRAAAEKKAAEANG